MQRHAQPRVVITGRPVSTRLAVLVLLVFLVVVPACGDSSSGSDGERSQATRAAPPASQNVDFTLPEGPSIVDVTVTDAPSYLFLFTHTEDQFNHELYEERYRRVGAMIEELAATYPDLDITWTIEFQGSDAEAIRNRNPETGLVDYLLSLKDRGLVEFGYHAHHDPTYQNRPQNDLPPNPTFEEVYDALWTWITCRKDPTRGGCVAERGGGLEAVLDTFGQVKIVTGLGEGEGLQVERSAGSLAVRELLSDRLLGFGFPDHGALSLDREYLDARDALLALMTPTHDTSSGTLWMDNSIVINDSASLEGVNSGPLLDGPDELAAALDAIDGTRSFVLNVGVASKYLYTADSTSPTKWAYVHPDSPELPDQYLQPPNDREKRYALTEQSLQYLGQRLTEQPARLQFVSADDVLGLFTSEDYWDVGEDELEQIALWTLNQWDSAPPNWVYDGEDFYSLADALALLEAGLTGPLGEADVVSNVYGPWSVDRAQTQPTSVTVTDLRETLDYGVAQDGRILESYTVGGQTLTATQFLYALSYLYVLDRNGIEGTAIQVPQTMTAPETLALLQTLSCEHCLDTAWSLKPARFQQISSN